MAENKTQPTAKSVPEFLEQIEDPKRRADCIAVAGLMEKLNGSKNGKGCLYIKKLEDIDMGVLESLITTSINRSKET